MHKLIHLCTLLISMLLMGCYDPDQYDDTEFNPDNYEKYLQVRIGKDSIAADGSATVSVEVLISKRSKPEYREIEITATKGAFIPQGTKTIKIKADEFDAQDKELIVAKATLRSEPSAANVSISAKVRYLEQTASVKFHRVAPTGIAVTSKKFFITQSLASVDTVIATLKRQGGTPTAGHPVDFFVITEANDTVVNTQTRKGYYREHKRESNDKGETSMIFSLGQPYLGRLKIISYTEVKSTSLKDSTYIEVINN